MGGGGSSMEQRQNTDDEIADTLEELEPISPYDERYPALLGKLIMLTGEKVTDSVDRLEKSSKRIEWLTVVLIFATAALAFFAVISLLR